MKIGFVSIENPYDYRNNGGIGTYTGVLAEALVNLGNEIHLITVGTDLVEERQIMPNLMVHYISEPSTKYSFYLEQMLKIFEKIKQIKRNYGLDIVEAPEWLAQGFIVANEDILPLITRLHTPLFLIEEISNGQRLYRENEDIKRLERLQTIRSRAVTSPSTSLSQITKEKWGIESVVIYNPINIKMYEASYCEEDRAIEEDYILFMGRLEYRKGVLVLAESLKKIIGHLHGVKVVFCGQDTYYKKKPVKALILEKCKGLEDRIEFIEHVSSNAKISLLKNAKAVVLPSLWENFSYVALEAMCLGKTVVATRVGGFTEMIEHGKSGYLVEPGQSNELGEIVYKILKGQLPTTGTEAKKRIQEMFDISILSNKFLEFYKSLL